MIHISCVMPAYKRVDQTIKSLNLLFASEGVGKDIEMEVVVADSTPDTTLKDAVLAAFGERIVYVKPDHEGIAANKNAGAKAAKHPILIFLDSDMEVEPQTIARTIASLQAHPKAAAVGSTVIWRGGPHAEEKDRPRLEDRLIVKDDTVFIEALYSRFLATYKDIFWSIGGYDEAVFNMRGEGSDLSIRYWRAGLPLSYDESIVVHHVHDVPDAAAVRVDHPEWGIAKDLLLLGYKYDMYNDGYQNFPATVDINFSPLGAEGYYRMLQGIGRHFDYITSVKPALDAFRAADKPEYDFKFLEVFTNAEMFGTCIDTAGTRLTEVRAQAGFS
jgi:glycosyltransferase involved in cell wall biosynthesis